MVSDAREPTGATLNEAPTSRLTYEATSRFAQAGPIRLHYNEAGEGEVLLMIHGAGPGATAWSNFKGNLSDLARRFRVLLIDQPGFGESDKPHFDEPLFDYMAARVRDLMDTLAIEKAHFVGNSLGGGTTLKFAMDFPGRTNRIVLMGPGGAALMPFAPEPSEGMKHVWGFYEPPGPSREKLEAFLRIMVYDQSTVTPDLIEERYQAAIAPDIRDGQIRVFDAMRSREFRTQLELWRELHRVKQPVLLMWGRDDRTMPLEGAFFALKRLRDAQLHVFSRCGHWCQVEHREAFNRLVIAFLDE